MGSTSHIKCLQSDNGREYTSLEFDSYLKERGVVRRLTVPHNPEQNGTAERKNRTLFETARCLLLDAGLPEWFWAEAVNTANYIRNRLPTKSLNGRTPFEMWTGKVPDISNLRVFGTRVFYLDRDPGKGKLENRVCEGIFLGYSEECKGFCIWSSDKRRVLVSRDVRFLEELTKVDEPIKLPEAVSSNSDGRAVERNEKPPQTHVLRFLPTKEDGPPTEQLNEMTFIDSGTNADFSENEVANGSGLPENESEDDSRSSDYEVKNGQKKRPGRPKILRTGLPGRPKKQHQYDKGGNSAGIADAISDMRTYRRYL